jgi:hypothetical protein
MINKTTNEQPTDQSVLKEGSRMSYLEKKEEIRNIKQGEWFTLRHIEEPKPNQVWIRNHYDQSSKTYSISNWSTGQERFVRADRKAYLNFTF